MRNGLTLDQMLSDTIVQLVMRRDGVTECDVRAAWASLRQAKTGAREEQLEEAA